MQKHVCFLDGDKSFERRAIENALIIQGFFQLSGGDGHIFHHSKHIGKLQADKFNIFFLRHLKDRFLRILCHIDSLLYQRRF